LAVLVSTVWEGDGSTGVGLALIFPPDRLIPVMTGRIDQSNNRLSVKFFLERLIGFSRTTGILRTSAQDHMSVHTETLEALVFYLKIGNILSGFISNLF
jgi:hypothetical protein